MRNHKKKSDNATRSSVIKEMDKPRMAKSAKIADLNLDTTRIPEQASVILAGTVDKIIPPRPSTGIEKVQIGVEGADRHYRDLRIENLLVDEHGDDVTLKKGARVHVTITDETNSSNFTTEDS